MDDQWKKLRNKYRLKHSDGKKTEVDDIMEFLNPHLKTKKSVQKSSSKANKNELFEALKDPTAPDEVSADENEVPTQMREPLRTIYPLVSRQQIDPLDVIPQPEIVSKSPENRKAQYKVYSNTVRTAFNNEIKKKKLESTVYILNEIENFKKSKRDVNNS